MIRDELITYDTDSRDAYGNQPIVDTQEIVRCRDCKFYILDEFDEAECHQFTDYYDQPVHWPEPDGFCSYGARRDEER